MSPIGDKKDGPPATTQNGRGAGAARHTGGLMKVIVKNISTIMAGGKVYRPDDELELADQEAKRLIARGLVSPAPTQKKVDDNKKGEKG